MLPWFNVLVVTEEKTRTVLQGRDGKLLYTLGHVTAATVLGVYGSHGNALTSRVARRRATANTQASHIELETKRAPQQGSSTSGKGEG